jgi:hypothetical protein
MCCAISAYDMGYKHPMTAIMSGCGMSIDDDETGLCF